MDFWEFIGYFFWAYIVISFIAVLIGLIFDVFRDQSLGGFAKAAWVVFLVVLPILASVVYLIARGGKMSERQLEYAKSARAQTDDYIRTVASTSSADEIAKARALLDGGSITAAEFEALKARALAGTPTPAHAA
ncbi:SHOCT domain-containing protein [Conyzicola nivalis]|uniref:Membrane protein n=1 Tax=Conyzicola nivalis TaxID=1477021 RepID=A0A916WEZ6_9MICO|nr:SHOCT domain-containing protein [Conyzicola nivalis]GGA91952.1 membrane protein [Conyzicola nivalis]